MEDDVDDASGLKAMKNLQREDRLQQCGAELHIRMVQREASELAGLN